MNLYDVALSSVEVVHVTTRLLHEHALNQLASHAAIMLSDAGGRGDLPDHLLELRNEELLRVTVFAPPAIFGFEPLLGLIEQDDLHDAPDTAPSTPTRPSLGLRSNRRARDQEMRAARHALGPSARRRSPKLRLPLRPEGPLVHPGPVVRSLLGSCVRACPRSYRVSPRPASPKCIRVPTACAWKRMALTHVVTTLS